MTFAARPTRHRSISKDASQLLEIGESGRCEFKRDANAVKSSTLAALANWVALDANRQVAHLLVGVDEKTDDETGLVSGSLYGLDDLDKAVSRLQDIATKTWPIPVELFIVEEAADEAIPFLRIEIKPTMPPHYDGEGRRQTRQGRSTRPLTDDELLQIYLNREAGSFAARFRQTSTELREAVGAVSMQVDQIADAIDRTIARPLEELTDTAEHAAIAADAAESAASNVRDDLTKVERLIRELNEVVEEVQDNSPASLAARVAHVRRCTWWAFTIDTWDRSSKQAIRIENSVREVLSQDISIDADRNAWEIRLWNELLANRKSQKESKGTLKWWRAVIAEVVTFQENTVFHGPELPDFRAELREDLAKALSDPASIINQFRTELQS